MTTCVGSRGVCAEREESLTPLPLSTRPTYDFAGRTFDETALQMGVPEAEVRSFRRSALRWLRRALL